MKVLIMVLSSAQKPYYHLMKAQQQTWDSVNVPDVETVYYYGNHSNMVLFHGKEIACDCSDAYEMMHWKFKRALDFVWDWEWDFIFRTNSSTFVRKDRIVDFLKNKPMEKYYAGLDGGGYASGTGAILSRDCAKIVKDQLIFEPNPSEDSIIGVTLQKNGIFVQEGAKRLSFNFAEDKILDADYYRCKSELIVNGELDRTQDIFAFNKLMDFHYS